MPGKPKEPNKTYSSNYGGARTGSGRPPTPYRLRQMKLPLTDEELAFILRMLPKPRQRVEAMLREAMQRDSSHPHQNR